MGLNKRLFSTGSTPLPDFEFSANTYSGNGSTNSITGVGFKPDLVFTKWRSATTARNSCIYDVIRGTLTLIASETTGAEGTVANSLTSFDSDGFTLGNWVGNNQSGSNWISWNFKAGGAAVSNTNGDLTSDVSASNGFSIVKYTGSSGATKTVGHGLNSAPELILCKNLDDSAQHWSVYSSDVGNGKVGHLNLTNAFSTSGDWGSTTPTSSVFTVGSGDARTNSNGEDHIAYCFHSVSGKIDIGTYTGNGTASTSNPIVTTGFQPSFLMIKRIDGAAGWTIFDSARSTTNPRNHFVTADSNSSEGVGTLSTDYVYFESTGFRATSDTALVNGSEDYIYLAIA